MSGTASENQVTWVFGAIVLVLVVALLVVGWSLRHRLLGLRPPWRLLVLLAAVYLVIPPALAALGPVLGETGSAAALAVAMVGAVLGWVAVGLLWLRERRRTT